MSTLKRQELGKISENGLSVVNSSIEEFFFYGTFAAHATLSYQEWMKIDGFCLEPRQIVAWWMELYIRV